MPHHTHLSERLRAARRARCVAVLARWAAANHSTWICGFIDMAATQVFTQRQWNGI
jgi:hypothetical protein